MATVGSILIKLEAQSAAFNKGIKQAENTLKSFSNGLSKIKALAAGALAFAGVGLGISALKNMVSENLEAADSAYKLATSLNIATDSLMGLQAMAKKESDMGAEEFSQSLNKLAKQLGEANAAGGPVKAMLDQLGLSASSLANGKIDTAFISIADKISQIQNPTERARALVEIFGKSGQKLAPMFAEGAAGIHAAIQKAKELGIALTDADAAKMANAKDALETLGQQFDGIKMQLSLALIPYIQSFADSLSQLGPNARDMSVGVVGALKDIAYALAYVGDFTQGLRFSFAKIASPFSDSAANYADKIWNSEGVASQQLDKFFADVETKAQKLANELAKKKNNPLAAISQSVMAGQQEIAKTIDELRQQVESNGMSKYEQIIYKLSHTTGITGPQIMQANDLVKQLETIDKQKKGIEDVNKLWEDMKKPLDVYYEKLVEIDDLKNSGVINAEQFEALRDKLVKDLYGSQKLETDLSVKSYSGRMDWTMPNQPQQADPIKRLEQNAKLQLEEARKQTALLRDKQTVTPIVLEVAN